MHVNKVYAKNIFIFLLINKFKNVILYMQGGTKMEIYERFQAVRKELGLSRRELGEKLGVSESMIVNIEFNRLKRPVQKDPIYMLLCEKCNVSKDWLWNGIGEMFISLSKEEQIAEFIGAVLKDKEDSFKKRYVTMLSSLDDDGWEALEKVANALGQLKKD